ncbi:ATP-binding protein [Mucilaginibacter segetis]|uniref:histidine kinase n=1 Tax=Mucilaginibacter segetis TaxID=2793071 RepID=A0A934UNM6_9SPHI|nr:ATP-binding protein [Mucilaginibacter segetis]MBK0380245.1 GHKL domain-containing protein [Mucilaginibacter segetis]
MTTAGKIRGLLALLFVSLLITAIVVERTYTPANNLAQSAGLLENNLHKSEGYIYDVINNKASFNEIKKLDSNNATALNYIDDFTIKKRIWIVTYKNKHVNFWSGIKFIPGNPDKIKEGCSFLSLSNAYYEVIKKSEGDFIAIFFIPVKNHFAFQNKYLQNIFTPELSPNNNIEIADFTDKNIYSIHDLNGTYLFSVKLIKDRVNVRFFYFELTVWLLAILSLCILVHVIITYLANKGLVYLALLTLAVFIVAFRYINLHYDWPNFTQPLKLFNPIFYASSAVYPSLGDFCLNILSICWFVSFLYTQRNKFIKATPGKVVGWLIFFACLIGLFVVSTSLLNVFYGLVVNSKISFDVNNILNLTGFSMLGVLMLCFSFLIFLLFNEVALTICFKLRIPAITQLAIFTVVVLVVTGIVAYYQEFTIFYVLWGILVIIRGCAYLYYDRKYTAFSFISIVLLCALITSVKLHYFQSVRERETRKVLIQRLEIPDDVTADVLFKSIEKKIITDPNISQYYNSTDRAADYLKIRLQKLYFDRYLSKYNFQVHAFDEFNNPISGDKNYSLDVFKDMVLYSSIKVSNYFYRENESFGFQSYFAILPVIDNQKKLGTIVIELKSKPLLYTDTFPELLIDEDIKREDAFKDYSYAFYTDDKLVGQSGSYVYKIINNDFRGKLKKYVFTRTNDVVNSGPFQSFTTYSHLLYKPSERNLIVVTKEKNIVLDYLTSLTFFFVVLLAFSALVILIRLLWIKVKIFNFNNNRINWNFKIGFDKILYKTRIQFSMIFAVVITLILVGFITFISISTQYQQQQDNIIRSKIMQISAKLENGPIDNYVQHITEESRVDFDKMADTYSADLTLFDLQGIPLITTQPKIYEYGLLARRMNARAYIALNDKQQSEFVNDERIGGLSYKAAYAPLRNLKHETIAYLQLPYFANAADYTERVGSLLNIMINVYALVFIAIGLFAVIIARQITAPLNFIQYNLSKTMYGKKNEPIKWERDDEIGALVKEYNNMIAALENSANKLAQSERETAWREMAKQVAHEIKNPLTPLKLGLQLLDKSWKDKDPKFDQKFERFSKSFVEQIESLASIASEFSAFAKMPDTRIEKINIFEMLGQAVTIFKHMDNVKIALKMPETPFYISADRDQLLRCFNNLLKNAIEATPQEKQCIIEINFLVTSKNVLVTIKDNGNGIPEGTREKIFEPNFTTKSSGTGLGLAFVKNSIENANGKIWFETSTGVGTTFYLNFPVADENA